MEERKLSRKDLRRCWRAWMMHNLSSMSFERLESFGFCLSMLPVAKKLYPDPVQRTEMLRRHASFYNTEPQIGAIVNGMALGLEEKKANGEPIDGETINTLKVGLMGPIAGIGDSMIPSMLIPILLSIGMALAAGGNILGPLFYTVAWRPSLSLAPGSCFSKATRWDQAPWRCWSAANLPGYGKRSRYWAYLSWAAWRPAT